MTELIDTCAVTVTDEITLLRERLDEAHAQLDNVEYERDAALNRISQLTDKLQGVRKLLNVMTDARNEKLGMYQRERKAHDADIERLLRRGEKREIASAVAGFIAGVASAGLILAIVYLIV